MARKKTTGEDIVAVLVLIGAAVVYFAFTFSVLLGICLVALMIVVGVTQGTGIGRPALFCGICQQPIRGKYFHWEVNNAMTEVCPTCNHELRRKKSRAAVKAAVE